MVVKLNYDSTILSRSLDVTRPEFLIHIHQRLNGFCSFSHVVGQVVTDLVQLLSAQMPGWYGETFAGRASITSHIHRSGPVEGMLEQITAASRSSASY